MNLFYNNEAFSEQWQALRPSGRVVFTNGCFDILHVGHVRYLNEARALGAMLVLGLNSDASVARLKGPERPFNRFQERAEVLLGLRAVDLVVGFEEDTPLGLIEKVAPDVLVKGGDWAEDQIVGATFVRNRGGLVRALPFVADRSTTTLVERIRASSLD